MPATFSLPARALRRHLLLALSALLLAACQNMETRTFSVQTAAAGTLVEARQVVALVYAQAPNTEVDKLLYSGGDLTRVIERLRDRYPQLKPLLDEGAIGNTVGGFVALRDDSRRQELAELLWQENRDRAILHGQATVAVGHGNNDFNSWLPYASYSFGKEWIGQGRPDWWWLDDDRRWRQTKDWPG